MHRRVWQVAEIETVEELAHMLTEQTWVLCSGFSVAGHPEYLFLNDATCEDGAGEYGVIKGGLESPSHMQIESITFSWCSYDSALGHVMKTLAGEYDESDVAYAAIVNVEPSDVHVRCRFCA